MSCLIFAWVFRLDGLEDRAAVISPPGASLTLVVLAGGGRPECRREIQVGRARIHGARIIDARREYHAGGAGGRGRGSKQAPRISEGWGRLAGPLRDHSRLRCAARATALRVAYQRVVIPDVVAGVH